MKKLELYLPNGRKEVLQELTRIEILPLLENLKSFKIIHNPSSVITFRIENTNYFFRDGLVLINKIKNSYKVKTIRNKKISIFNFTKKNQND